MFFKKMLPGLIFVSLLAGVIFQTSSASLSTQSHVNGFLQPNAIITVCAIGCSTDSIQYAIDNANSFDIIALAAETFTETITIDKSLTISGTGFFSTAIQAAGQASTAVSRVITVTNGITVEIDGITIQNGNSNSNGGGILNQGVLTLKNCQIIDNRASNGGGIANLPQTDLAKVTISNTTIEGNEATISGGGIYNFAPDIGTFAETNVFSSTIVAHAIEETSFGGGAANIAGQGTAIMNITNSTFSANGAETGGGIYTHMSASGAVTTTLAHSTLFGNSATFGSNIYAGSGNTTLNSSILAYGQIDDDCQIDGGTIIDGGFNLVQDACGAIPASGDPRLGALADNGGDTKTHALLSSSSALDIIPQSQCNTFFDQRGAARPFGAGCDSGAFESNVIEIDFQSTASDTYIKPDELAIFTTVVGLTGPGITGGIINADLPEELTIEDPVILDPPGSGVVGIPPILAHSLVISANQTLTLTMAARVAEGIKAGTILPQTIAFTSPETPTPVEETIIIIIENVPPIAVDDQGPGFLTNPFTDIFYTDSVFDNDIDLNGDDLEIINVNSDGLEGEIICDKYTGVCAYDPHGQFDNMIPGQTETDTFAYTIIDGAGGIGGEEATATVTITLRLDAFTIYLPLVKK